MSSQPPNLSDSNLRRRSFRGQNLEGANFRGADLRGSDFSQANLSGANFAQAKLGICPTAWVISAVLLVMTGAFGLEGLSQMIFGVLGMTKDDPNHPLRLVLVGCLAMAGGLVAIAPLFKARRFLMAIAAMFEGVLFGSYYGGLWLDRTLFHVCLGAGLVSLLLVCGFLLWERRGFGIGVITLGLLLPMGCSFWLG
ncbi:MAG: pentapeptide repeat-containing protein [Acaryochloridaceae cyanobacterium RL_2_7]|nr:pentapeptide repeat-containing protein [Acaryochloridaceae cyanobacterium RL_2_7]